MVPTSGTTYPRADLMGAYSAYDPNSRGLVASLVLPSFGVVEESGVYSTISREAWLQNIDTKRGPRSEASTSERSMGSKTFSLVEYAHKALVTRREARQFRTFEDLEMIETQAVAGIIAINREIDTANAVFNTSTFATSGVNTGATAAGPWDVAAGTPATDVAEAVRALRANYGVLANTLILTDYTFRKLGFCTQIRNLITDTYAGQIPGTLPIATLSAIFGLPNIIVAAGVYNSAKPGATASISSIWDEDKAMVCRIETGMDLRSPQLGRTLELDGVGPQIRSYAHNDPEGVWVQAEHIMTPHLMDTPVGYLITNTKT